MAIAGTDQEPTPPPAQAVDDEDYTWPPRGHVPPPVPPHTFPQHVGAEFAALERLVRDANVRLDQLEEAVMELRARLLPAPATALSGDVGSEQ